METVSKRKKRSAIKKNSKEAKVLRFLRKSKNLSMRKAAALIGKSDTFISHLEHGRLDIRNNIIQEIVTAYGHNMDEFQTFMEQDESLFIDYREDLINFIHKMDDAQIIKAFNILKTLIK